MKKLGLLKIAVLVLFGFCCHNEIMAQGVIPKPKSMVLESGSFKLGRQTKIFTNLRGKEKSLFDQYLQLLPYPFVEGKANEKDNIIRLMVGPLENTADKEAYMLHVTPQEVEIKANTGAGLFYGMQTLFQLGGGVNADLTVPCVRIADEPRFVHRGYMLDVSRHFFPKAFILKLLDLLAYYKINVFHFHIADTGGWRIEIKKYPKLTEMTAYRPFSDLGDWWGVRNAFCTKETEGAYGGFYTQDEIREIVAYATIRHIDVIPEIDMPGHSRSVLWAYPEYTCVGKEAGDSNELCIGNEKTFEFCENVLTEIMRLFPSRYIHIGGDEANREIWNECPLCKKRMSEEHIPDVARWQGYFTKRIETFLLAHGKTIIGWDEILEGDISRNAVVMSWREETDSGSDALRKGFKIIQAPTSHSYLDYYQDNPYFEPKALLGYTPLSQTYSFEPAPKGDYDPSLVLGVQGNLWTEYVPTTEHAEYMTFPRVMAIAEVGWTNPELKSYPDFKERVLNALDYLKSRKDVHPFNLRTEIGRRPESLSPVNNQAKGKKVTYLAPYDPEFAGSKELTLTDGWLGDWNANGNRWQGFIGNMDVVIDMEQLTELHAIRGSFIQVLTGGQYLPDKVEVFLSDDGKDYRLIYNQEIKTDYTVVYDIYNFGWIGSEKSRYIRFHATKPISWGDILCDEIVVK